MGITKWVISVCVPLRKETNIINITKTGRNKPTSKDKNCQLKMINIRFYTLDSINLAFFIGLGEFVIKVWIHKRHHAVLETKVVNVIVYFQEAGDLFSVSNNFGQA